MMDDLEIARLLEDKLNEDPEFSRVIMMVLAESGKSVADGLIEWGDAVGYEPTGLHANKIRDAQSKLDMARRRIARWEKEGWSHFTEYDIPEYVRERFNYHGYDKLDNALAIAIDAVRSRPRNMDFAVLNGVMHFSGGGYDELLKYMWVNGHMAREEVVKWNIDSNAIENCGGIKKEHIELARAKKF